MEELFTNPFFTSIFALPSSLMFAMSLKAPKRSVLMAAIGGFIGQLLYVGFCRITGSMFIAVFIATLATGLLCEICSRIAKAPATVIAYPALMPLVPGLMLYQAMLAFSQSDMQTGTNTLINVVIYTGCMAVAITASSVTAKHLISPLFKLKEQK